MMPDDPMELAAAYRNSLRHAVYLIRSLDAEGDLSTAQVSILNMVADAPMRVGDIARAAGIKVPSATEQVTRLDKAGLVARIAEPSDARVVLVQLTDEGRRLLTEANCRRNARLASHLQRLEAADQAALTAALPAMERLNAVIAEHDLEQS